MDAIANYLSPESQQKALEDVRLSEEQIQQIRKINIVASGASRHAGMAGEFMIERMARLPAEVDFASQYCYRDPITEPGELTILLSQSGTTADTIAAQREAKAKGARTVAICNVKGSPITQESDGNVYTHCGEEVSVAATKSFTAQLIALFALAVHLGSVRRSLTAAQTRAHLDDLMALPEKVQRVLETDEQTKVLARQFEEFNSFMFLGRDISYPIALEGALKLKETSYIHAEGFPTGEMKHGPNALVDENLPVVMIMTRDVNDPEAAVRHEKSVSLLREVASRGTKVIVLANPDDTEVTPLAAHTIPIPTAQSLLLPVLEIIPLQLLAYHIAVLRGVNVDHPRNLSKSVTRE
jgi:glutamine---fructose-6-phosphate transaminase (isomerizing)